MWARWLDLGWSCQSSGRWPRHRHLCVLGSGRKPGPLLLTGLLTTALLNGCGRGGPEASYGEAGSMRQTPREAVGRQERNAKVWPGFPRLLLKQNTSPSAFGVHLGSSTGGWDLRQDLKRACTGWRQGAGGGGGGAEVRRGCSGTGWCGRRGAPACGSRAQGWTEIEAPGTT